MPAFLAGGLGGAAQALGLVALALGEPGALTALRRLDGGRRERLGLVPTPAVCSVEGATARLRRASLPGVVAAGTAAIEVVTVGGTRGAGGAPVPVVVRSGPYRPRARRRPSPSAADPHTRILALTGAMTDRTPPVLVHLDPAAAAERILDQLRLWGYPVPPATAAPVDPAADVPPATAPPVDPAG